VLHDLHIGAGAAAYLASVRDLDVVVAHADECPEHPLDPGLGIAWPTAARDGSPLEPLLSDKDAASPSLAQAREAGLLPTAAQVEAWTATLPRP